MILTESFSCRMGKWRGLLATKLVDTMVQTSVGRQKLDAVGHWVDEAVDHGRRRSKLMEWEGLVRERVPELVQRSEEHTSELQSLGESRMPSSA